MNPENRSMNRFVLHNESSQVQQNSFNERAHSFATMEKWWNRGFPIGLLSLLFYTHHNWIKPHVDSLEKKKYNLAISHTNIVVSCLRTWAFQMNQKGSKELGQLLMTERSMITVVSLQFDISLFMTVFSLSFSLMHIYIHICIFIQ